MKPQTSLSKSVPLVKGIATLGKTSSSMLTRSLWQLMLLFLLLASHTSLAQITLVQKKSAVSSSASQLQVAPTSAITAGNLLVVAVSSWSAAPTSTSITDSLGNSYLLIGSV